MEQEYGRHLERVFLDMKSRSYFRRPEVKTWFEVRVFVLSFSNTAFMAGVDTL